MALETIFINNWNRNKFLLGYQDFWYVDVSDVFSKIKTVGQCIIYKVAKKYMKNTKIKWKTPLVAFGSLKSAKSSVCRKTTF